MQTDEIGSFPISVPFNMMKVTGLQFCSVEFSCSEGKDATLVINFGQKCASTGDHLNTFEYTFKGDIFQVNGTCDSQFHIYDVYVDNALFATINQNLQKVNAHYNISHQLEYEENTIKIKCKGQEFEIYMIVY